MDLFIEGIHRVSNRHVTDHQVRLCMTFRQADGPAVTAEKAAISSATAYRREQDHLRRDNQGECRVTCHVSPGPKRPRGLL